MSLLEKLHEDDVRNQEDKGGVKRREGRRDRERRREEGRGGEEGRINGIIHSDEDENME